MRNNKRFAGFIHKILLVLCKISMFYSESSRKFWRDTRTLARVLIPCLAFDDNTHRAGGASDDLDGAFHVDGVELTHLDLGDFFEVGAGDFTNFFEVGFAAAFFDFDFLAN